MWSKLWTGERFLVYLFYTESINLIMKISKVIDYVAIYTVSL